jgi:DNA end-binding protein Ku
MSAALKPCPDPVTEPSSAPKRASAIAPATRGRPTWSGLLRLSLVTVPVKAYPAVSSAASTSPFHMLHADCHQRITYQKHCPTHGALMAADIVRGYEYARGQHVVVEAEELEQLRPARDKALLLEQFVGLREVDPTFFAGRSLYLVPDGVAAQHPYAVLAEVMGHAGKAALGRVVLSNHRQLALVRATGRLLVLDVLHYPTQVRMSATWQTELPASAATAAERDLAAQLIALASGSLDWARYQDTNAAELAALIEAKIARQPPAPASAEPMVLKLLDALKASVAAACDADGSHGESVTRAKTRKPRGRKTAG